MELGEIMEKTIEEGHNGEMYAYDERKGFPTKAEMLTARERIAHLLLKEENAHGPVDSSKFFEMGKKVFRDFCFDLGVIGKDKFIHEGIMYSLNDHLDDENVVIIHKFEPEIIPPVIDIYNEICFVFKFKGSNTKFSVVENSRYDLNVFTESGWIDICVWDEDKYDKKRMFYAAWNWVK